MSFGNPNISIQKRALKNSFVGFISFVLSMAQSLITVPILLSYWGNEYYAIWLSLFAITNLFQSIDNGHINYIGNKINLLYNYDKAALKTTLSSSVIISIILGSIQILLLLSIIVFDFLPQLMGLNRSIIEGFEIQISIILLISSWLISGNYGGILHRLMIPAGLYTQSLLWGIVYRLSQFFSIVVVVILGGNILEVSISYSFIQIIVYFVTFIYIKFKIPEFYPWWSGGNFRVALINFRKSLLLTFNGFIQQLSNNGLIIFISNLLSSATVPAFTTLRTLTNTATSITNILISSLLPDIARFHISTDIKKINSIFHSHWFFSGIIVNIGIILILPFVSIIYKIWTNGLIEFNFNLFLSLAASISVLNFGSGLTFYLISINRLIAQTLITFLRAIIIFGFGYLLVPILGLVGIGIAILLSEIVSSVILPYHFTNNILKTFNGKLNTKSVIIALIAPAILILLTVFNLYGFEFSYFIWGVVSLLILLTYIINWIILDPEVKIRTLNLIRNIL